tara:strand:+ start:518 stop:817 length:300 start_codon:yes stop_codon:yes gene_type:complete
MDENPQIDLPQPNRILMQEIIKLRHNAGYQALMNSIKEGIKEKQYKMMIEDTPEKILLLHAEWKASTNIFSFLINEPQMVEAQYMDVFGVEPQNDLLVN